MTSKVSALFLFSFVKAIASLSYSGSLTYSLEVNSGSVGGKLHPFWRSTGFCPPLPHEESYKFDLSNDMTQNLAYIGAVPHTGIEQVRIHYLLELVSVSGHQSSKPVYNFTHLDTLIEQLFNNGLRPGFEIMGNPSDIFTDFENATQVYMWKDLVQQVAQRYIDEFGLGYVISWNFETWNEPDCHDFNLKKLGKLKVTIPGFLNYFDACSEGLKAASPLLKLGGPADGCGDMKFDGYGFALYRHVVNGTNFFTKQRGVRLDFVSMHKKGSGSAQIIRTSEISSWLIITGLFPTLRNLPFYNDEGDPLVGWSKDEWWRADATYAAVVAKIVGQHQNIVIGESSSFINFTLLSNDNGFLSYYPHQFTQRTLVARFQMNNTSPPHVQFIRKPVYAAMALLSLLGEKQLQVQFTVSGGEKVYNDSSAGVLATVHEPEVNTTADSWQMTMLVYNSDDTNQKASNDTIKMTVTINPPDNNTSLMMAQYKISRGVCDPHVLWTQAGKPDYPDWKLLQLMRQAEGPCRINLQPVKAGVVELPPLLFELPGVSVIHVCSKPQLKPDQVNGLNFVNITSGQVLITWSDKCVNSRCIKTYDVEFSPSMSGNFIKVNNYDSFVTAFVYSPQPTKSGDDSKVLGYYRIRAVDYWGRAGQYSLPTPYPQAAEQLKYKPAHLAHTCKASKLSVF